MKSVEKLPLDLFEEYNEPAELLVISAPSGAGKSTICRRLISNSPGSTACQRNLTFSVSTTTRSPRQEEVDGTDYRFVDDKEFDEMIQDNKFIEWAEVYGERYGTTREDVKRAFDNKNDVMLEIDVQGARQVKESIPSAVLIFISPPSIEELERRLNQRGTESQKEINRRLKDAHDELNSMDLYDYVVINDEIENAVNQIRSIRRAEKSKISRIRSENSKSGVMVSED